MRTVLILTLLAVLGPAPGGARAQDPPPPIGGFGLVEQLDLDFTYTDGYRTRIDLRYPDPAAVAAPPGGWPAVLFVPAGGDSRKGKARPATDFARRGYVAIAYDVRGQGETIALNPGDGGTMVGGLEKGDMVEILHRAAALLGPIFDFGRLAVRGTSQGAGHAWAAAAWSGNPLVTPRGPHTHFPSIRLVSPGAANPDFADLIAPQLQTFSGRMILKWFVPGPIVFEPAFLQAGQQAFLAQDFDAWRALIATPWRADPTLIRNSTTAVFAHNSWYDWWATTDAMVDAINSMPASTPRQVHVSTGEHGSPLNHLELATWEEIERRWFAHIMKGRPEEVAQQPRFQLSTMPADPSVYLDIDSVWQLRHFGSYPATGVTRNDVLYLRQTQSLDPTPPSSAEPADPIHHNVPAGYGPSNWLATRNRATRVLADIPLDQVEFVGPPASAAVELTGRPALEVEIDSTAANLQLHAVLFDQSPAGARRWVADGFRALRGRVATSERLAVPLTGIHYVLPAGHRWVLVLENHTYRRPPGRTDMHTVPYFDSYRIDVVHTAARPSRLSLPVRAPALSARPDAARLSAVAGGGFTVRLRGTAARAGMPYATLLSVSGTLPGVQLFGAQVPINWDPLTAAGLAGGGLTTGFVGVLDAAGSAQSQLTLSAGQIPLSAVGWILSVAAVGLTPGPGLDPSAASATRIDF